MIVAIPVMLVGVVLMSGIVGAGRTARTRELGVAIGLITAVSYAGYLLVIRRASPTAGRRGPWRSRRP